MTTDAFTTAARAEAEVQCGNSFDLEHFMAGAEWARTHLAEREPTDAECLVGDIIRWDDTIATDGPCDATWDSLAEFLTGVGWTRHPSARAVGRDAR